MILKEDFFEGQKSPESRKLEANQPFLLCVSEGGVRDLHG